MTEDISDSDGSVDLADPSSFGHWTTEKIRFQDVNRFDHVSNVAIAAYAESGRVEFLEATLPASPETGGAPYWVVARLTVRFHAEILFPGSVRVGTCVLRIGNSSVTLGQGMFVGERCASTTESVIVLVDPQTGRGRALDEPTRTALAAYVP